MNPAEKLLKMIEEVDPADSDTLDEIDARFWCFKKGYEFSCKTYCVKEKGYNVVLIGDMPLNGDLHTPRVTRSRDALKAIRPDGWYFDIECTILNKEWIVDCGTNPEGCSPIMFASPHLSTEELAELHAIIQVIEWECDNA